MSLSMYQASVPAFLQTLNNLSAILDKAEAYAGNRKIDPEVLLNYRLAPDMLPFVRQIQIAADLAKGAAARLADVEVPKHDDTEKTFADLKARITNTVTFVQSIEPSDIDGSEGRDITLTLGEHTMSFKGQPYLVPAGTRHNIINGPSGPMKLYTLYSPPNHRDGVVHATKADAEFRQRAFRRQDDRIADPPRHNLLGRTLGWLGPEDDHLPRSMPARALFPSRRSSGRRRQGSS